MEPYFNETGSNCPSILPKQAQVELLELSVRAVQVRYSSMQCICLMGACAYDGDGLRHTGHRDLLCVA